MLEHRDKYRAGFLHGRSGAYAVHAVVSAAAGKDDEAAESARAHADIWCGIRSFGIFFLPIFINFLFCHVFLECFSADACDPHFDGCDELLFGRAGYVCGALWIRKHLGGTQHLANNLVKLEEVKRYFIMPLKLLKRFIFICGEVTLVR